MDLKRLKISFAVIIENERKVTWNEKGRNFLTLWFIEIPHSKDKGTRLLQPFSVNVNKYNILFYMFILYYKYKVA